MAANCSDMQICHNLINSSLAAGHVGYFQTFADIGINIKKCHDEHESADILLTYCFHFLWINTQKWNTAGKCGSCIFQFLRCLHTVFQNDYAN